MVKCIDDYFDCENISSKDSEGLLTALYNEIECQYDQKSIINSVINSHKLFESDGYWMNDIDHAYSVITICMYAEDISLYVYMIYMHILKIKYQNININYIKFYKYIIVYMVYKLIILYENDEYIFKNINTENILSNVIDDLNNNFNLTIDKKDHEDLLDLQKIINNRKELMKCFLMK